MVREFDDSLTQIKRSFGDARYLALLKHRWGARAWKPDDPCVMEVAYVWSEEYAKQSNPCERAAKVIQGTSCSKGRRFRGKKGSIFALLGSNGAGKTTIVKILTTLLKPDGGTATVDGFDVASKPDDVRQSISLTGQFAAVDEILTGRENLIMIARLRRIC